MRTYGLKSMLRRKSCCHSYRGLNRVSGERIRDELLKCVNLPDLAETYRLFERNGIFKKLFEIAGFLGVNDPDDASFERFSRTSKFLPKLEYLLDDISNENKASDCRKILAENDKVEDLFANLQNLLNETIQGGRSRRQLLLLFAFFFSRIVDVYRLRSEAETYSDGN